MPEGFITPSVKKRPTVALFSIDRESQDILRDCFTQFSIDVTPVDDTSFLRKDKFEGCVVSMASPAVETTVAEARNSALQKRMVIYAVGSGGNLRTLTKYGINVVLDSPITRPAALKAIHSTRLLLLNELRRYLRLPLAAPVSLEYESRRIAATSVEVSAGGMSISCKEKSLPIGTTLFASFAVPGSAQLNMAGTICWIDEKHSEFGLRFEPSAEDRRHVKAWIETYLGIE